MRQDGEIHPTNSPEEVHQAEDRLSEIMNDLGEETSSIDLTSSH